VIFLQLFKEVAIDQDLTKFKTMQEAKQYYEEQGYQIVELNAKKFMAVKEGELRILWKD
jgi:TRAP-type C4-dicarboxylate transport system substrate-binding protein